MFTSRPQDLEELVLFWNERGEIGSCLELVRNSIERRLAERGTERNERCPLSREKTRQGARLLAGAVTLMQVQTIKTPANMHDSQGIGLEHLLPEWTILEQSTLLSRPIFDDAIYGQVRFHHRTVREYLAAEWLHELLKQQGSRRTIEGLIFRQQYGVAVIVPQLRPILPWLCILDPLICERVSKEAPDIFFEGGDPSYLNYSIRRSILIKMCEQLASNAVVSSVRDRTMVQLFAKPDLVDDIHRLLQQYHENNVLVVFLVRMIWLGKITGLADVVLDIALRADCSQYLFVTAYRALKSTGTAEQLTRVREHYLFQNDVFERDVIYALANDESLTQSLWQWLLACLLKVERKEQYSADSLTLLIIHFIHDVDIEMLPTMINDLNQLLNEPPISRNFAALSEKYIYLLQPAAEGVKRLIMTKHSAAFSHSAFDILHKLPGRQDAYNAEPLNKIKRELAEYIQNDSELNNSLFWFEADKARAIFNGPLISYWKISPFGEL
ncbi:hypothetical protein RIN66_04060 [Hafnia alvei]|uniref:hypothetical protein n=1 Tax=Hafnia alvei TaxID=569 RepID=UPI0028BDD2E2|nr:hypothetical protein [Hafnia alvei]WNN53245.1 hypothetical protein RIN66_04060 [Hafnia alvei]